MSKVLFGLAWSRYLLLMSLVGTLAGWAHAAGPTSSRTRSPSILILVGDDHAAGTMGIDGDPRRATPHLDRLAHQGVRFSRAFCNAPLCTPSRQSFITGRYPHAVGVTELLTPLPDSAVTLGDWLSGLGYATGAIGKMHFNSPAHHGFRERLDTEDWFDALIHGRLGAANPVRPFRPFVDPVRVWLNADNRDSGEPESAMEATYFADQAAAFFDRHRDEPFLLVVGFHEPHSPFTFPQEFAGRYSPADFTVPPMTGRDRREQPRIFHELSPADVRGIQAAYFHSLAYMDHEAGRILDALDASGLADDTIVVYLGDNGYLLGQHGRFEKNVLYEPAVRVPLLVRWPGHLPAGRAVPDMVELVDLVPTLLDLAGQPSPPDLHGRSLVALLKGDPGARGRETVFSEYLPSGEAMIRSDRYKLIVGSGRKTSDPFHSAHDPTGPYERLFDLAADPGETTDLSARLDLIPVRDGLLDELYRVFRSTPGVRGPIPEGLSRREGLLWCLVPRDRRP
jgi:choline-sulfatase